MQQESFLDKSHWPAGPWQDEPDRAEWRDDATGLPCLAIRHPRLGHWCGYVAVPPGHLWHKVDHVDRYAVDVHGGVTFSGPCEPEYPTVDRRLQVCHVPEEGEAADVWWLGFDCAHAWDMSPGYGSDELPPALRELGPLPGHNYRTLDFVRAECALLAREASDAV